MLVSRNHLLSELTSTFQISYAEVLLEFPFKGDEAALRGMEHAELISITTQDGKPRPFLLSRAASDAPITAGLPVAIRPGKPVYRYVFQRLVNGEPLPETPLPPVHSH